MINGMPPAIALAGCSLALSRFEGHHFTATVPGGLAGGMAVFAVLTFLTCIHALYSSATPPVRRRRYRLRIGTMPALRKARSLPRSCYSAWELASPSRSSASLTMT